MMLLATSGAFCGYGSAIWLTGKLGVNRMIILGTTVGLLGAAVYLALPLMGVFTPVAAIAPIFPLQHRTGHGISQRHGGRRQRSTRLCRHRGSTERTGAIRNGSHRDRRLSPSCHTRPILPLAGVIFFTQFAAFIASIAGWRARPAE